MKNLSFALIAALYASFVMRVFTVTKSFETIIVFGIAASPALLLALRIQGRSVPQKRYEETSQYPWLSLAAALASSIALIMFVLRFVKRDDLVQFFGGYIMGWTPDDALIILAVSIVMAASGVTIWTSYRFRSSKSPFIKDEAPYVFYAGAPERTRLIIYMYVFALLWSLGVAAQAIVWQHGLVDQGTFIRMSRAGLPLAALLIIALARVPFMAFGALVAAGGAWYVVSENFDPHHAAVAVGVPVAFIILYVVMSSMAVSSEFEKRKTLVGQSGAVDGAAAEKELPNAVVDGGGDK